MIKKFKNGNIVLDVREDIKSGYYNIKGIENFYNTISNIKFSNFVLSGLKYFNNSCVLPWAWQQKQ